MYYFIIILYNYLISLFSQTKQTKQKKQNKTKQNKTKPTNPKLLNGSVGKISDFVYL